MTRADLIAAVRAHAARYYACGWDMLAECWTDDEIGRAIGDSPTVEDALRRCADHFLIPVRIDEPYVLSIHAEDGEHYKGFASFALAVEEWVKQTGREWDQFSDRAWAEHQHVAVTDDYGRRIILQWNR